MLMTSFLKDRKSTREFRDKAVSSEIIKAIEAEVEKINQGEKSGDWSLKLFNNGEEIYEAFKDKAGYAGVMIKSPVYIAMATDKQDESLVSSAYHMEKLITELHKMNLGTCWVTIDEVSEFTRESVLGQDYKEADYVLAVGYQKMQNPFAKESFSERKSLEEIVCDEMGNPIDPDFLEQRGLLDLFYYIRYAPSKKNAQPWIFVLKDNKVSLYMEDDKHNLTDAGIIMYYFEELAKLIGINNQWKLAEGSYEEYIKIGEIFI